MEAVTPMQAKQIELLERRLWDVGSGSDTNIRFLSTRPMQKLRGERVIVAGSISGTLFRLQADAAALALMVGRREPGLELGPTLDGTQRALAIAYLFSTEIAAVENTCGARLAVSSATLAPPAADDGEEAQALHFIVEWRGVRVPASLQLPGTTFPAVHRFLRRLPADQEPFQDARIVASVRLGTRRLRAEVVRSLKSGDGLVLPGGLAAAGMLVLGERMVAKVAIAGDEAILEGPPAEPAGELERSYLQKEMLMAEHDDVIGRGPLGGITVEVAFEVGRRQMTLAAANQLAAGDRIALGRTSADAVDLICGGRIFGSGRLIDVEGSLVVEVLEILS